MSIEVNGVSLPDIPSDVLASYPYVVIQYYDNGSTLEGYYLLASTQPFGYLPPSIVGSIMGDETIGAWTNTAAYQHYTVLANNLEAGWTFSEEVTTAMSLINPCPDDGSFTMVTSMSDGSTTTSALLWANHNVEYATPNDDFTAVTLTGETWFPSSVSVSYYAAPKSWYDGMAQQVMRLTGTSDKLTTDEMLELLTALNADSDGDTGGGSVTIVPWSTGTDEEIAAMVAAMDAGTISIEDTGWAIGDERVVTLSAMAATGVGETHAEQSVTLVLMDSQHFTLTEATAGGDTKDHFVVGLKHSLNEAGYMNSSDTNSGSWSGSARRTWCNNVFRAAIPETLRGIFKQFKCPTATTYNGSSVTETDDYFALFAEKEIFGSVTYSNSTEAAALSQIKWYETAANRIKQRSGSAGSWWGRSPGSSSSLFCYVASGGSGDHDYASSTRGLAPFGCI